MPSTNNSDLIKSLNLHPKNKMSDEEIEKLI